MPVIYLSPFYSLMSSAAPLEGLAGFRHFDRYGGSQAVWKGATAFVSSLVPIGSAAQGSAMPHAFGAGLGNSLSWLEGISFNTGLLHTCAEPYIFKKSV